MRNTECGLFIALMYSLEYANIHSNHVLYLLCDRSSVTALEYRHKSVSNTLMLMHNRGKRIQGCYTANSKKWKNLN